MAIDLHNKKALLNAAAVAKLPIAFLVGSPLSIDNRGGIPGVGPMIDLVRDEIRVKRPTAMSDFEAAINGKVGVDIYQVAMKWLQGNLLQETVNHVVERAVLLARKAGAITPFDCDGAASDWYIPAGTRQIAELVCRQPERFPGPILTTNFDPLLSIAIYAVGGRPKLRVIQTDGRLNQDVKELGVCEVVHLHGYWRGFDTLHTPIQITSPRPKLKASLNQLLRKRTLIVAAYGGWDDVFAQALTEALSDEDYQGDVLWCFYETDAAEIEAKYNQLFERVADAIIRGRFLCYGGIDCHTIFAEFGGLTKNAPPVATISPSPLAGWIEVDSNYLNALSPLRGDEVIKYFDGAVPTWRHAVSNAIPRRQVVSEVINRLATFQPGNDGCSLQLIRAAGGEGKTTLLLQVASDAIRGGGWSVLWRPSPQAGLPPEHIVNLDINKQWLIVADDAENLVYDLSESARLLHEAGRSNVHFLLATRDADWWAKLGDKQPWETWLKAWVRRNQAIILRGISRDDAKAVVEAWSKCGPDGLRELADLSGLEEQVNALVVNVQDAVEEQNAEMKRQNPIEGSFFGGLLTARFGQNGLQAHVQSFLNRLKEDPIEGSSRTLFDALVYIAACHAVCIPGIDENILADLVGVPREWVQSRVVRPLGEETAAVHSAGHVFTRHGKVAAAILIEADQTLDIAEVWSAVVRQTVRTSKDVRMDRRWFSDVVHASSSLQEALPSQLSEQRRKDIAIAAAKAFIAAEPNRLSALVDLGKTYRNARDFTSAVQVFHDNWASAQIKSDFADVIRGYLTEWGVCAGKNGSAKENAWLCGISLSDKLNPAPITDHDAKYACGNLGVAFGKLAEPRSDCPYARGRRAIATLGKLTANDAKSFLFDTYDREADKIRTPHPKDVEEAVDWLTAAIAQVGCELQDPSPKNLLKPDQVSFKSLRGFFALVTPKAQNIFETAQADDKTLPPIGKKDLRYEVWLAIKHLIDASVSEQRPLYLPAVGFEIGERFPEAKPVHLNLGFETLTDLVLSFGDFAVVGEHPRWQVQYRDEQQADVGGNLRYEVWMVITELIDRSIAEQRTLYLPSVGSGLSRKFSGTKPVYQNLGFATLTDLINSFDDFVVTGEHPKWLVQYRDELQTTVGGDLRDKVGAVISDLLDRGVYEQRPLYLPIVGLELARSFPEARPVHLNLGFATLTDLINSFDNFTVTGEHPRWVVQFRENQPTIDGRDLRSEVQAIISELIDRTAYEIRPLYLPYVGHALMERFPTGKPVNHSLGFATLTDMINSFDNFVVAGEHPRWFVQYREGSENSPNIL